MSTFILIVACLAALYGVAAITIFIIQPLLIYFPDMERVAPKDLGFDTVDEIELETPDGERLVAWYAPPATDDAPTLLYFHGSSGNLARRKERMHRFVRNGYGVLMPSYRGYSGSTGKPSQAWLTSDGLLAYDHLIHIGTSAERIILYGESLGTGIAAPVAAARDIAGLVLEAPFTAAVDIAEQRYPFLPVRPFMYDKWESIRIINRVHVPLLIIHGAEDKVVPVHHGKTLFAAASHPKDLVVIEEAGHTGLLRLGAWEPVQAFIERHGRRALPKLQQSAG